MSGKGDNVRNEGDASRPASATVRADLRTRPSTLAGMQNQSTTNFEIDHGS